MSMPVTTTLGTPCSVKWTPEWRDRIDHDERQLNRRICGAHTPACTPCKLSSTHPNGRCRFHGGHPDIGAPLGNRNAVIHGLYSRRLKQCGIHCPLWSACPMAGPDVLALDPTERPACVYEQQDYDQTIKELLSCAASETRDETDELETDDETAHNPCTASEGLCHSQLCTSAQSSDLRGNSPGDSDSDWDNDDDAYERYLSQYAKLDEATESDAPTPLAEPIAHNVALLQAMLNRAAATLTLHSLTDQTEASSDTYRMTSTKISAMLNAFLKIARELRAWLRYIPGVLPATGKPKKTPSQRPMGLAEYAKPILERAEGVLEDALEFQANLDAQTESP